MSEESVSKPDPKPGMKVTWMDPEYIENDQNRAILQNLIEEHGKSDLTIHTTKEQNGMEKINPDHWMVTLKKNGNPLIVSIGDSNRVLELNWYWLRPVDPVGK